MENTGAVHHLIKTVTFIAIPVKQHIQQLFILPKDICFFVNFLKQESYGFSAKVLPAC